MSGHTPAPWHVGRHHGSVVADVPTTNPPLQGKCGHSDVGYYGGHLVCESVANEANVPAFIAAAPGEMLDALHHLAGLFEALHPAPTSEWGDYQPHRAVLAKARGGK